MGRRAVPGVQMSCRGGVLRRSLLAAAVAAVFLVGAGAARAELYDVPILVDSEDDLLDYLDNNDITESEFEILIELFQRRVYVNRATRDELFELPGMTYPMVDAVIAHRRRVGVIEGPAQLDRIDGLPSDVVEQIASFLEYDPPISRPPGEPKPPIVFDYGGQVRVKMLEAPLDDEAPVAYTRVRLHGLQKRLRVGWVGMGRTMPGRLQGPFPGQDLDYIFVADPHAWRFEPMPKLYASWRDEYMFGRVHAIAGSFNAGFGERLVLDTTNRRRPYGLYEDDLIYDNVGGWGDFRGTFRPHRGLFGGAVHVGGVGGDTIWADATVLASKVSYDQFSNFFNPSRTYFSLDAESDGSGGQRSCGTEGRCFGPETFPRVRHSTLVGGNARVYLGPRNHVGFTGYWSTHGFHSGDEFVTFSPSSTFPIRKSYWAMGPEVAFGYGPLDVFAEVAFTDLGGVGAVARALLNLSGWAIEVSGRYYDDTFDNPYGRGEASTAQFLGRRNRDEVGGRARVVGQLLPELRLQTTLDLYHLMSRDRTDLAATVRVDYDAPWLGRKNLRVSGWITYRDRDLTRGGRSQTFMSLSVSPDYPEFFFDVDSPDALARALYLEELFDEETGLNLLPRGMRVDFAGQVVVRPLAGLTFTGFSRYSLVDEHSPRDFYSDRFRRMFTGWFRVNYRPVKWIDFTSRVRYFREDMDREARAGFVDFYLRVGFALPGGLAGNLRYDLRSFVIPGRERDPDHLVRATVDWNF